MKMNKFTKLILLCALLLLVLCVAAGCGGTQEVPTEEEYFYVNPDETTAETDAGFTIDGVLDEEAYKNNNWLYLHNDDGGNNVTIAMTSFYGEKGMYFVCDVTESVPIYVNLQRASYMNSCIEMYFAPSTVTSLGENSVFEVDLLPTGDMTFKKSNGKGGYVNVATTDDIMAHLGATTKGGPVNSEDCYGYCLELFIPWDYMEWLGLDAEAMKTSFVYINPAHITSNNLTGTDTNIDRYWYYYAQQHGAGFSNVFQYFRFDKNGALGTAPITLEAGENCTLVGDPNVIPGMYTTVAVTPESGYAISSILVNGEEYIGKVAFNEDGSVTLKVRGEAEGLNISAAAEAVTEGNRTLSGKVTFNKAGGDSLNGVLLTYTGPLGERPIELSADGSFTLTDLKPGYYVLTVEKQNYAKISRGIYLDRDRTVDLTMEYDMFYVQNGTSWILDDQNDGVLKKFGGTGYLLSNISYNDFTFTTSIRYDEALAKEASTDAFQQQRSGMRICFENGKYLYLDLLKEGDKYILQYANHSNSITQKWKTVCVLDANQIAQYKSEKGIELKVVRSGRYTGIWLGGKLITITDLGSEYAYQSAQPGFEFWAANRGVMEVPYSISAYAAVDLQSAFLPGAQWNTDNMFFGSIASTGYVNDKGEGDTGWLNTVRSTYRDVTVKAKDLTPGNKDYRLAVHFTFTNAHTFRISLTNTSDAYTVQTMSGSSVNVAAWRNVYTLSPEETAKVNGNGVDFRVVIVGEHANVYLDNIQVCSLDISKDTEGKATDLANKTAQIGVRMYGNKNKSVSMAYKLAGFAKTTTVTVTGDKATVNGVNHIIGETIVIKPTDAGAKLQSLTVDGSPVTLREDGTYRFTATAASHTVEVTAPRTNDWDPLTDDNHLWDLTQEENGIISGPGVVKPNGEADTFWMFTYDNCYRDISLTLSDMDTTSKKFRMGVRFVFTNGEEFRISLTNANGSYAIQTMGSNTMVSNWTDMCTLTDAQAAKVTSADGAQFRVAIIGTKAVVYLDGEELCVVDLSGAKKSIEGVNAKIAVRLYGNNNKTTNVAYTLGGEPETTSVQLGACEGGDLETDKSFYVLGENITVTSKPEGGNWISSLKVDGVEVTPAADGSYTFRSSKKTHKVEATFAHKFDWNAKEDAGNSWVLTEQTSGVITSLGPVASGKTEGDTGWVFTHLNTYRDITLKLSDLYPEGDNFRMGVRFVFTNGEQFRISLTNSNGPYGIQLMSSNTITGNWGANLYDLTADEVQKLQSADGIQFRVSIIGDEALVFLDGKRVVTIDLSGATKSIKDVTAKIAVRLYGNNNKTTNVAYTLGGEPETAQLTIAQMVNGTVTADRKSYLEGETVTLTVAGNTGYAHDSFTVNGQAVVTDLYGKYSFTAQAENTVTATFAESLFVDGINKWLIENQHYGEVAVNGWNGNNAAQWLDFRNKYTNMDIAITVREYADTAGPAITRSAIRFMFDGGKRITVSLAKNTITGGFKYSIQSVGTGDMIVGSNYDYYVLSDDEIAKFQSDEGIELRVVRNGVLMDIYLDGKLVVDDFDLSQKSTGVTATTQMAVTLFQYDDPNIQNVFGLKVSRELPAAATVTIDPAITNGKVTTDKDSYIVGEKVTLTVAGNSGYAHDSLMVNGKAVVTDLYGNYTFTAEAANTVTATFAESLFVTGKRWHTENQFYGEVAVSGWADNGHSDWLDFADTYTDIDIAITVREYEDPSVAITRSAIRFGFNNWAKHITFSIAKNTVTGGGFKYSVQSLGGIYGNNYDYYVLNADEIAKFQSDAGIQLRVIRRGDIIDVYLDGKLVAGDIDLTKHGVAAGTAMNVTMRQYDDKNIENHYGLSVSRTMPQAQILIDPAITGGKVTVDKAACTLGEKVTVTVTADAGNYQALTLNGEPLILDWKTGTYTFEATKLSYTVSGSFKAGENWSKNGNFNLLNQHQGVLALSYSPKNSGWIDLTGEYDSISVVAKNYLPMAQSGTDTETTAAYSVVLRMTFDNGKIFAFRIINDGGTKYGYSRYGAQGSGTGWGGWKSLTATALHDLIHSTGAEFKLERSGNTIKITLNGETMETYTMSGVTADNKVVSVGIMH